MTHAGERFEKYGCALYTAVALWASSILVTRSCRHMSGGGRRVPIKEILSAYRNIDTSGIDNVAWGTVVELRYIEHNRRVERQTSFMNPILPSDVGWGARR